MLSSGSNLRGIIAAGTGLIAAAGAVVGVLVGVGILPPGGSPAPVSELPSDAGQQTVAFHELQVTARPLGAAEFVLNPIANAQGRYAEGTRVTIDGLPAQGRQVEKWLGPVDEDSGLSAEIIMDSNQTVVVVTQTSASVPPNGQNLDLPISTAAPAPTPTLAPVPESKDRVKKDLVVLYDFEETSGTTVNDVSGFGTPLNLTIRHLSNVSRPSGALSIDSSTIVGSSGPADKLIKALQATNEISIEVWVKPANTSQTGPARIVTLSANEVERNFTLAQGGEFYDARLRTEDTDFNGKPSLSTPEGTLTTNLTHVVYTRGHPSGDTNIYIDGSLVVSGNIPAKFTDWDEGFKLALANEFINDRTWLGELHLVAVFNRALTQAEVTRNFNAGPSGITPP